MSPITSLRAMPCIAKKTFEAAKAANAHLIVQLKDNQLTLCRKVEAFCRRSRILSGVQTTDAQARNRHETRIVGVFDATAAVARTEWAPYVAAAIQVERNVLTFQPATGFWKDPARPRSISPIAPSMPNRLPMPFVNTGVSKMACTTSAMSPFAKMPAVFAPILVSSPDCAALLTIFYVLTSGAHSPRIATLPLLVASTLSLLCAYVNRTEQPWGVPLGAPQGGSPGEYLFHQSRDDRHNDASRHCEAVGYDEACGHLPSRPHVLR